MHHDWKIIADALRQEIAGYGGLLHLFEEQQRRLFARDADAVLHLSGEIESQVHQLHEDRRNREQLVAAFATERGEPPSITLRALLPHFAADVRPLLEALVGEINVLIHRVRRVSRHNHSLLARTVESQQQLLRQLRPDAFTHTYASSGRVTLSGVRPQPVFKVAG
jgi:flagellar biosynthesis/type III secretory pathway chaperone